mmetsp:Transcript_85882/g.188620  ORF Transcript_85882/g.188620 Transcript_85882/m.188620 type:complete len:622 (+) Transcript_85882:138-2003(+)
MLGCCAPRRPPPEELQAFDLDRTVPEDPDGFAKLNETLEWARRTLHKAAEAQVPERQLQPLHDAVEMGDRLFSKAWARSTGDTTAATAATATMTTTTMSRGLDLRDAPTPAKQGARGRRCCSSCSVKQAQPLGPDMSLRDAAVLIEVEINSLESTPAWAAYFVTAPPDSPAISSLGSSDGSRATFQKDVVVFGCGVSEGYERHLSFVRGSCSTLLLEVATQRELYDLPSLVQSHDPVVMHIEVPVATASRKEIDEIRSCILANLASLSGGPSKRLRIWVINAAIFTQDELDVVNDRESSTFVVTWRQHPTEASQAAFIPWLYGSISGLETLSSSALEASLRSLYEKLSRFDADGAALLISAPRTAAAVAPTFGTGCRSKSSGSRRPSVKAQQQQQQQQGAGPQKTNSRGLQVEAISCGDAQPRPKLFQSKQTAVGAWEAESRPAGMNDNDGEDAASQAPPPIRSLQSYAGAWEKEVLPGEVTDPDPRIEDASPAAVTSVQSTTGVWEPVSPPQASALESRCRSPTYSPEPPDINDECGFAAPWQSTTPQLDLLPPKSDEEDPDSTSPECFMLNEKENLTLTSSTTPSIDKEAKDAEKLILAKPVRKRAKIVCPSGVEWALC